MKKFILIPAFVIGAMAVASAQPTTTTTATQAPSTSGGQINTNGPVMTFDVMSYDFGKIKQGDIVTKEFHFKNTGKEPLIINEAHGSCGCTVPDYPKEPIRPGAEAVIKVTFNSAGKLNAQDKTVTITYDTDKQVVLHLTGTVEAPASTSTPATNGGGTATPATSGNGQTAAPKTATAAPTTTTATPATAAPAKPKSATAPANKPAATTSTGGGN